MNSQSVLKKSHRTGLFFAAFLFLVLGSFHSANAGTDGKAESESCELTNLERHWQRNPESQWPVYRRERLRKCEDADGQQPVKAAPQGKRPE